MRTVLVLSFAILLYNSILLPHEDHKHENKKSDTVTVVGKDTIAINGILVDSAKVKEEEKSEDHHLAAEKETNLFGHLTEHLHNKIVHLPVGFVLVAYFLSLIGFKKENLNSAIKVLVIIAGLSSIAAYFAGIPQQEPFIATAKESIMTTHHILGITSAILIWLWAFFLFYKPLKKFGWLIGTIVFLMILITGLYGGIVAH